MSDLFLFDEEFILVWGIIWLIVSYLVLFHYLKNAFFHTSACYFINFNVFINYILTLKIKIFFFGCFLFFFVPNLFLYFYFVYILLSFYNLYQRPFCFNTIPFLFSFCLVISNFPGTVDSITLWMEKGEDYKLLTETLISTLRADPALMKVSTDSIRYVVHTSIVLLGYCVSIYACDFGFTFEEAIKMPLEFDFQNHFILFLKKILLSDELMNEFYKFHRYYLAEKFRWDRPRADLFLQDLWEKVNYFLRNWWR